MLFRKEIEGKTRGNKQNEGFFIAMLSDRRGFSPKKLVPYFYGEFFPLPRGFFFG
jgi:hypothetical protein